MDKINFIVIVFFVTKILHFQFMKINEGKTDIYEEMYENRSLRILKFL